MKRQFIFAILAVLGFAVFWIGCQDDLARITKVVNEGAVVEQTRATALSNIIDLSRNEHPDYGVCFSESEYPTVDDDKISLGLIKERKPYETILRRLKLGREYHCRPYVFDDDEPIYGDIEKVTINSTEGVTPTVNEIDITGFSSANVLAGVSGLGSLLGIDAGICYTIDTIPTIDNAVASIGKIHSDTVFSVELEGLNAFADYQVRAFCRLDSSVIIYGQPQTFNISAPSVQTTGYSLTSLTSINVDGNLSNVGIYGVSNYGICWASSGEPTINDNVVSFGQASQPTTFTAENIQLSTGSTYSFRAFATSAGETYYGSSIVITANDPTVQTISVIGTPSGNISMNAEMSSYYLVERGFCWSTSSSTPTINDQISIVSPVTNSNGSSTSFFTNILFNQVELNAQYAVRAFVRVGSDVVYGNIVNFNSNTFDIELLSFEYDSTLTVPSGIIFNGLSGNYIGIKSTGHISDGYFPATEVGICISETPEPGVDDYVYSKEGTFLNAVFEDSIGLNFEFWTNQNQANPNLIELVSGGQYYIRAFGRNGSYIRYSQDYLFTANHASFQPIADCPVFRAYPATFSADGKGFVVGGSSSSWPYTYFNDVWEYDPQNNSWIEKSSFPGPPRSGATTFSVGDYAYLVGGTYYDGGTIYRNDLWRYSPTDDEWVELANIPITGTNWTAFSHGSNAYLLAGLQSGEFWKYSVDDNIWISMTAVEESTGQSFSSTLRKTSVKVGQRCYVFTNQEDYAFEFDLVSENWMVLPTHDIDPRYCFAIDGKIYIGKGWRMYDPLSNNYLSISAGVHYFNGSFWSGGLEGVTQLSINGRGFIIMADGTNRCYEFVP